MPAQTEKGAVNPATSVIGKSAGGCRLPLTGLIEKAGKDVTPIRGVHINPLVEDGGRYLNCPAFSFDETKLFECCRIVTTPGGALTANPHLKGADEYITVFSGETALCLDAESHSLSTGGSIRFRADVHHGCKNPGGVSAEPNTLIYHNARPI